VDENGEIIPDVDAYDIATTIDNQDIENGELQDRSIISKASRTSSKRKTVNKLKRSNSIKLVQPKNSIDK